MFGNRQLSKEIKDLVQPLSPNPILTHQDMCNFMMDNRGYRIAKDAFMNCYYLTRRGMIIYRVFNKHKGRAYNILYKYFIGIMTDGA